MTTRRQHRPTMTIARNMTEDAETIQHAYDLLANELTRIEAWPTTTLGDGTPRSSNTATQPEREAIRIDSIINGDTDDAGNHRASIWLLNQLGRLRSDAHRDLMDEVHRIIRRFEDAPHEPYPRCKADSSHEGYLILLRDGGWHDPDCRNYARSRRGGLCNTCRVREDRWRATQPKLSELDDERPIDHDSEYYIDDNGVAHARPTQGVP